MKSISKQLFFLLIFLTIQNIYADRRYFGRSYLANTLPAKAFEFELWNTARVGRAEGYYYRFQPKMEFEYGITDKLTSSFFFNFNSQQTETKTVSTKEFSFDGMAMEFRYRLTDLGEYFVDPALYFEFNYSGAEVEYESKLILSKRTEKFVSALNFVSEIQRDVVGSSHASIFETTGGVAYDLTPGFSTGVEFKYHSSFVNIYGAKANSAIFLGPTVNILTDKFYFTINFLAQVSGSPSTQTGLELKGHEKYELRTIIGIEL